MKHSFFDVSRTCQQPEYLTASGTLYTCMEAALQKCKPLGLRPLSPIINAGEHYMAWLYEIRDSTKTVVTTEKGYATQKVAMAAGRKKARELKASGSLPGGGVATIKASQYSEVLHPINKYRLFDKEIKAVKADEK
jgi:hypothetical protein